MKRVRDVSVTVNVPGSHNSCPISVNVTLAPEPAARPSSPTVARTATLGEWMALSPVPEAVPGPPTATLPVDLGSGDDFYGTFVRRNNYGIWCTVPGFSEEWLIVSSLGWVRTKGARGIGWNIPSKGCLMACGYFRLGVAGHQYLVHRLILRAFRGPCPPDHTCDHIAKYDGDLMRERGDNRLDNLRWANWTQQRANQGKRKNSRAGKPIYVRHKSWPETTPWIWYSSAEAANRACGITGLAYTANPDYPNNKSRGGWLAKLAPAIEPQEDLPPDPDYRDAAGLLMPQPAEEWRTGIYSNGQAFHNVRVSNRGRLQVQNTARRNDQWGHRMTPVPTGGMAYAQYASRTFHILVFCSFGGVLQEGETVDHIDRDKASNILSNLRASTASDQVNPYRTRTQTSYGHTKG